VVDPRRGKPAVTHFKVLERFQCRPSTSKHRPAIPGFDEARQDCYFLVEARPETGRTHQIRAHLAALDFSLVGDLLYGSQVLSADRTHLLDAAEETILLSRAALHAHSLTLDHPVSGERLTFEAPEPEDFAAALRWLREFCALE
jgi:23S rRNA-/tRNA-specific pseudouridylate synthase